MGAVSTGAVSTGAVSTGVVSTGRVWELSYGMMEREGLLLRDKTPSLAHVPECLDGFFSLGPAWIWAVSGHRLLSPFPLLCCLFYLYFGYSETES